MAESTQSGPLRELGAALRQARERADISQRELARLAGIRAYSRISEAETGKRLLNPTELEEILVQLNVGMADREQLAGLARAAEGVPGELNVGTPGIGKTLAQLIDYERVASRIVLVAPLLIPGLLQTSDYARQIMGTAPDPELRVALRSGRRDILTRRNPVELLAIIDSEALLRPIAPPDVMADQLRHVLHLEERPNVTVQVVSSTTSGYHPMLAGPFELIEFPKSDPVVLLDHHRSSTFLFHPDDVAEYVAAADMISQQVAMTSKVSVEVIAGIVQGMRVERHDDDTPMEEVQP